MGVPAATRGAKLQVLSVFAQLLRRYTSLNHLAQAARAVLANSQQINQVRAYECACARLLRLRPAELVRSVHGVQLRSLCSQMLADLTRIDFHHIQVSPRGEHEHTNITLNQKEL